MANTHWYRLRGTRSFVGLGLGEGSGGFGDACSGSQRCEVAVVVQ